MVSSSKQAREAALSSLATYPFDSFVGPVASLLWTDCSKAVKETCIGLLIERGAAISLCEIGTDGWLQQVGRRMEHFDKLCEIVGEKFVAYSLILGLQFKTISVDPRLKANTAIEFTTDNNGKSQILPLFAFQAQVAQSIVRTKRQPLNVELPLTLDQAATVLGGTALLLPSLFGISLEHLVLANVDPREPRFLIGYIEKHFEESNEQFATIDDFDVLIREKVSNDQENFDDNSFSWDLKAADKALEAYEKGELDKVISILETWPGIFGIVLKTPFAKKIEDDKREKIGKGLWVLGMTFEKKGILAWSEELYKLGLQFIKEGEIAAKLYSCFGLLIARHQRHSEAISPLRRALKLGAPNQSKLEAALGVSFFRTGKSIAAAAILEQLAASGSDLSDIAPTLAEVRHCITSSGLTWNVPVR